MSLLSFSEFKDAVKALNAWDPSNQYISKDLTLKAKPKTCWQRFKAIFSTARSKQIITALNIINNYAETYADELTNDKKAVKKLKALNVKIHKNLASNGGAHVLKNKKRLVKLHNVCKEIEAKYEEFIKANPPSKSSRSLHSATSSSILSKHPSTSSKHSSTVTVLSDSKKSKVKTHPSTTAEPDAFPVPDPAAAAGKKPIKKIKIQIDTAENLKKFIKKMKPSSAKEATALLKALEKELKDTLEEEENAFNAKESHKKKHLRQKFESEILTRSNGNALLIRMNEIKADLGGKKAPPQFKEAHIFLATEIRRTFFAEVIKKTSEQLAILQDNMNETDKSGTPAEILEDWQMKLYKCKPIGIPKFFHCTTAHYVNTILQHPTGIEGQPPGKRSGYPGAFASSIPEVGNYGEFCFALSDHIETKVKQKYPIVTQVVSYGTPVYVGQEPKNPRGKSDQQPRIWLGFDQPFMLRRPDKTKDPLGYYEETTFALFANIMRKDTDWDRIDGTSLKELHRRKIRLLFNEDFQAIVSLIHRSFHFTLPADWGDGVKSPDNCLLVTPTGRHPLKKLQGVQYNP